MTWVITRLCIDCLDISCVGVCPVNCIYKYTGSDAKFPIRLFIDPQECIDCGACEPECPWEAIFKDDAVPAIFAEDIALDAAIVGAPREVPERPPDQKTPTPDQIKANKAKWGYS